ncbi:hypothetical protein [Ectopseudomonas oleovorans]|uniref:Uncharacterized protein n=1 Tax=Ectopseudomonas oleovorans (strain CECT 5344) TaxID=1182590 RepID=W6R117_ECTO5|nr:hypothetical protein [Pseudomonas oleovorans]CDM42407.1 hypothetical protein BN5_3865 [Pseudomonas oleovorans CECT 5344]CDR93030.1 hypothetical protein PPSAL_3806 [Pseudomonas oleovorans]
MLTPEAQRHLERLDTIGRCWTAVTDLMVPEKDLHVVDRDTLSCLFNFLAEEYDKARQGFTEALKDR